MRERASNARGRFPWKCWRIYGKERVRKWGFLNWVWKAVDLSTECEFFHIYGELLQQFWLYPQLLNDPYIVVISKDSGLIHRLWIEPRIVDSSEIMDWCIDCGLIHILWINQQIVDCSTDCGLNQTLWSTESGWINKSWSDSRIGNRNVTWIIFVWTH